MQARETCKRFVSAKERSTKMYVHMKNSIPAIKSSNEKFCSIEKVCLRTEFVEKIAFVWKGKCVVGTLLGIC